MALRWDRFVVHLWHFGCHCEYLCLEGLWKHLLISINESVMVFERGPFVPQGLDVEWAS